MLGADGVPRALVDRRASPRAPGPTFGASERVDIDAGDDPFSSDARALPGTGRVPELL